MTRMKTTLLAALLIAGMTVGCDRGEFGKRAEGGSLRADEPTNDDIDRGGNNSFDGNNVESPNASANNGAEPTADPDLGQALDMSAVDSSGVLAYKAYRAMSAESENVVISPVGLTRSFAVASLGVSDAGVQTSILELLETELDPWALNLAVSNTIQELGSTLGPDSLRLVPSVWAQDGASVEESFLVDLLDFHDMGVQLVDFGMPDARSTINTWFRNRTEGYIVDAVAPRSFPADTRLAFVDAAYFVGTWQTSFDADLGYDTTFRGIREDVSIHMMRKDETVLYAADALAEAVVLPYQSGFSLIAILPREDTLETVENALSTAWIEDLLARMEPAHVELGFPRVEVDGRFDLGDGSGDFDFTDDARATDVFANAGADLTLGNILQRTSVRFEETGTSAVMPTDGTETPDPDNAAPIAFTLNRPFIFAVHDSATGAIVLIGRVGQPQRI